MPEKVKLYRVENPNVPVDPTTEGVGGTTHPDLKGQWFSTSMDKALNYLPKATQYKPEGKGYDCLFRPMALSCILWTV